MTLFIRLLGQPEIKRDDKTVSLRGHKPLALLAYLLLTSQAHSRQHLIDLLHDESSDPRGSLRWTLSQLRQGIGAEHLQADRQQIGFNFESDYWLDVMALATGEMAAYRGEFLEGIHLRDAERFMEWAYFQRERLRDDCQSVLTQQLVIAQTKGDHQECLKIGHQLIQLDNLREDGYRALMQAYALLGNHKAALAQYDACCRVLLAEMNLEPDQETQALFEQIQTGTLTDPRSLSEVSVRFPPYLIEGGANVKVEPALFLARTQELERLEGYLAQALSGQMGVAFVTGGAGRGKTALLTEFARQAQASHPDLLAVQGNCTAYAGLGDPYLPFRDILGLLTGDVQARLAAGTLTLEHARRLWAGLLGACQALLDYGPDLPGVLLPLKGLLDRAKTAVSSETTELAQLRRLAERKPDKEGDLAQEFLFQQVTNFLRAMAERQPLLLMLDDLQWADVTSISLLFHLGQRLGGSRILIVGAYRPEEVDLGQEGKRHPLEKVLAEFKRRFGDIWIDLGQRSEEEEQQFIAALVDSEPNQLGPNFRQALYRHTNGHALFTIELLRTMQERGDLIRDEQGQWVEGLTLNWGFLPARVEAVIAERINRLEAKLREALEMASVEGEEFTAQVVARVQEVNERHLLRQLSQALVQRHGLLHEAGEIALSQHILSRYRFAHALFQRYLYNELSAGERRLLHCRVGTTLETLYGEQVVEIAVQLAHHFQEAQLPQKARLYLRQAGEQAAQRYANDEAVSYLSRAFELTPETDYAERYALLLAREKVYDLQGLREAQQADLDELQELAEELVH